MFNKSAVNAIITYVEEASKIGLHISDAILFGPYARGEANQESHINVLLVCAEYDEDSSERIKNMLWSLRSKTDSRIEPIPISKQDWVNGAGGSSADIARKEGIHVPLVCNKFGLTKMY